MESRNVDPSVMTGIDQPLFKIEGYVSDLRIYALCAPFVSEKLQKDMRSTYCEWSAPTVQQERRTIMQNWWRSDNSMRAAPKQPSDMCRTIVVQSSSEFASGDCTLFLVA
jgi:hypothetical protein